MKRRRILVMLCLLGAGVLYFCFYEEGRRIRFTAYQMQAEGLSRPQTFQDTTSRIHSKRSVVFLVSSKRSGSSFVGEYFNQHPDMFYIFEPLQQLTFYVLGGQLNNSLFDSTAFDIIQGLIDCRFDRGFKSSDEWLTRNSPLCAFNQEIGRSPVCLNIRQYNASEVGESLKDICLRTPDIVFKLIRVENLQLLKPFLQNRTLNTKVIYLVRDPRGTMNSRFGSWDTNYDLIRRKQDASREVEDVCDTIENNLRFWEDSPPWLNGRLKVLRYEDIALHPLVLGREIFRFVGRHFDMEVIKWLFLSTQNKGTSELLKDEFFQTSRDSAKRVTGWRNEMTWENVASIQRNCQTAMNLLGYLSIPSEVLMRDSSFPSSTAYDVGHGTFHRFSSRN